MGGYTSVLPGREIVEAASKADYYIKGDLQDVNIPKLLHALHLGKKEGKLRISNDKSSVEIAVHQGSPIHVTSTYLPNLALGELLLEQKKLTEQELKYSLKKMKATGKLQGEILGEMGILSLYDLSQILEFQAREKLLHIFKWSRGSFVFSGGVTLPEEEVRYNLDLGEILFRGSVQHLDFKHARAAFSGKRSLKLVKVEEPPYLIETLHLTPQEHRLFSRIDGRWTLKELTEISGLGITKTYQILHALYLMNLITFEGIAPQSVLLRETKATAEERARQKAKERAEKGYEIRIADQLLEEAVKAIERIEEEVKKEAPVTPVAPPPSPGTGIPIDQIRFVTQSPPPIEPAAPPHGISASPNAAPPSAGTPTESPPVVSGLQGSAYTGAQDTDSQPIEFVVEPEEEDLAPSPSPPEETSSGEDVDEILMESLKEAFMSPEEKAASAAAPVGGDDTAEETAQESSEWGNFTDGGMTGTGEGEITGNTTDSALDDLEREILREIESNVTEEEEGLMPAWGPSARESDEFLESLQAITQGEEAFQKGNEYLDGNDFSKAVAAFRRAVELDDQNPNHLAYLGWSIFQAGSENAEARKEAIDLLKKSIQLNPRFSRAYYFLGMVYKHDEQIDLADMSFSRALELDKNCVEAKEELLAMYLDK
ncbi:MAG: DUF4388 domain-containing protein [Deltaproteobacteria bacterium]|nr:MAG: DUF4388 domain-containing protein [Deltaproteobacteria bacterium]